MSEIIELRLEENPRLLLQCSGIVLCRHKLTFYHKGTEFHVIEGDNWSEEDPLTDLDNNPQSDVYPLTNILKDRKGHPYMHWGILINDFQSSGDSAYDMSIYFEQDNESKELAHYTNNDEGVVNITARPEQGIVFFKVV